MFRKSLLLVMFNYCKYRSIQPSFVCIKHRNLYTSAIRCEESSEPKDVVVYINFENIKDKNKTTYLEMVKLFETKDIHRRGHVEFIYSALKNMESFGVHKDLDVYKALVDVLPKGKFIPTNMFQVEFMHYPKQQQCAIDLLEQMEDNGVMPDYEMENILLNIFGNKGYPLRKFWRMMYWMPKFRNLSPWPLPSVIPNDTFELAKIAIKRMGSVDIQSKLTIYQTKDLPEAIDDTWIVSTQSDMQKKLLNEHNREKPVYVDGAFRIWIKSQSINYFILKTDPKESIDSEEYDQDNVSNIDAPSLFGFAPPPKVKLIPFSSVNEQEDAVIFAICITGTSSRDSLLSWIRHLEKDGNPALLVIPVVFTLRSPEKDVAMVENVVGKNIEDL